MIYFDLIKYFKKNHNILGAKYYYASQKLIILD